MLQYNYNLMKKILKNMKYIAFGFGLVVIMFSYSEVDAASYVYNCQTSGNITTVVSLDPSGPFTTTPTTFFAKGQIISNNCDSEQVSLSVGNNGGTPVSIIPPTSIGPNETFPFSLPASTAFQSPAVTGTYFANYLTGVDMGLSPCVATLYFSGNFRWGKINYVGPATHPAITVNAQLTGTTQYGPTPLDPRIVVFTIPANQSTSYYNGTACNGIGCEIEGTAGFYEGHVHSNSPTSMAGGNICGATGNPPSGGPNAYYVCFIADTKVTMADGTFKDIQDVKIGDILKGEKTNNKVLAYHRPLKSDGKIYGFNGGRLFVTEEHPFKTTEGWKSLNPQKTKQEHIGITVTQLEVGDTLLTESGTELVNSIESKNVPETTPLYNFVLSGDKTYYADGFLVHNKVPCDPNEVCVDTETHLLVVPGDPRGDVLPNYCNPIGAIYSEINPAGYQAGCGGNFIYRGCYASGQPGIVGCGNEAPN